MAAGRWIKLLFAIIGLGLLISVLASIDFGQVVELIARVGWGFLLVLVAAFFAFTADVASWLAVLPGLPFDLRNLAALWKVRVVGEMLNIVTPAAGVGGEPAKAMILINSFELEPRETIASVLVAKTTILLSYIPFLAIGFVLMLATPRLSSDYVVAAGIGLAIYTTAIGGFFLVQRYRITSRLGTRLHRYRLAPRLERALNEIRAVDHELERLYAFAPGRLWASLGLAFLGWVLGAAELLVISALLGYPLSLGDVWTIEAVVQLLRQATGFIPGSLGVTEGSMLLLYGVFTGDPSVGVAVALVRRLREVVFIVGGMAFGFGYLDSHRPAPFRRSRAADQD
jgi:glycosyltransferase 2 family protein